MFERLKELFANGKISEAGLNRAVVKGWITEEEAEEIKLSDNLEELNGQT